MRRTSRHLSFLSMTEKLWQGWSIVWTYVVDARYAGKCRGKEETMCQKRTSQEQRQSVTNELGEVHGQARRHHLHWVPGPNGLLPSCPQTRTCQSDTHARVNEILSVNNASLVDFQFSP